MTREEALTILREEGLSCYNWYGDHPVRPNEMILAKEGDRWVVSAADERAAVTETSIVDFDTEEEALDYFIPLVRLEKEGRDWSFRDIPEVEEVLDTAYWIAHPPGTKPGNFDAFYPFVLILAVIFLAAFVVEMGWLVLILLALFGLGAGVVFLARRGIRKLFPGKKDQE